ncbi:hypothetical protein QFC20_007120 [Naganishia adeliensis]|uniref:Uncharacterized protein n=1 Tax=Naganishia adeliensis TaxID=92952 RepID=A0ACC2V3V1_9TREE|nr:hypothetical protein QFC20_007120 [Naganishia adeliensis]
MRRLIKTLLIRRQAGSEALLVRRDSGESLMTGTVNQNAAVAVRVVKIAQETMIEGIIRAVFDASLRKAPIEKYAECITGMFVPVIVYLSIMNLAIWLAVTLSGSPLENICQ